MPEVTPPVPPGRATCPSDKVDEPVADEQRRAADETGATDPEDVEPPLLSKEQAIAEVRRWIERYRIDPNQIFARAGDLVVRYGDLIPHLEQETDEGRLLLRAISRGQVIRKQREQPGGPADAQR
jgi:hypothetical protein